MDVDIRRDWEESQRARERFLASGVAELEGAARTIDLALGSGRRVFCFGGRGDGLGRYAASLFLGGGVAGQGRRLVLIELRELAELAALAPGDMLLWLTSGAPEAEALEALEKARERAVGVVLFAGEEAGGCCGLVDAAVLVPSRHQGVVAEMLVALLHSLYKMVSEGDRVAPPAAPPLIEVGALATAAEPAKLWGVGGPQIEAKRSAWGVDQAAVALEEPQKGPASSAGSSMAGEPALGGGSSAAGEPELTPVKVSPAADRPVRFRCGSCRSVITVASRFRGQKGQCPYCLEEFLIPRDARPRSDEAGDAESPVVSVEAKVRRRDSEARSRRRGSEAARRRPSEANGRRRTGARRSATRSARRQDGASFGGAERRRAVRFEVADGLASFKLGGIWSRSGETIVDVSLVGVCVKLRHHVPDDFSVGEELGVALDFPAFVEALELRTQLRRVERRGESIRLAFEFIEPPPEASRKLQRLQENVALRGIRRR